MLGSKPKAYQLPLVVLIGALIVYGISVGKPEPEPLPPLPDPIPSVETTLIKQGTEALWVVSQGMVEPALTTMLTVQVAGQVDYVDEKFANGGQFAEGDLLVQLDQTDYEIAVKEAEASLVDAKSALAIEKGAARQAKREWRDLGSADANALFLRKPQVAAAEANILAAEARLKRAKVNLQRTSISGPYNGFVSDKAVDVGQFVAGGTRIGEVYASGRLEIRLPISAEERYLLGETTGKRVEFLVSQYNKTLRWMGKISRVESVMDTTTRQFYVVATLDAPFSAETNQYSDGIPLAAGQFVQARIQATPQSGVFRIPRTALKQPNQIWVVDDQSQLDILDVEVVYRDTDSALVRSSALQVQQQIRLVVSDLSFVRPGQVVKELAVNGQAAPNDKLSPAEG